MRLEPFPAATARSELVDPGVPSTDALGHHGLCSPTLSNHCCMYQA